MLNAPALIAISLSGGPSGSDALRLDGHFDEYFARLLRHDPALGPGQCTNDHSLSEAQTQPREKQYNIGNPGEVPDYPDSGLSNLQARKNAENLMNVEAAAHQRMVKMIAAGRERRLALQAAPHKTRQAVVDRYRCEPQTTLCSDLRNLFAFCTISMLMSISNAEIINSIMSRILRPAPEQTL